MSTKTVKFEQALRENLGKANSESQLPNGQIVSGAVDTFRQGAAGLNSPKDYPDYKAECLRIVDAVMADDNTVHSTRAAAAAVLVKDEIQRI